MFLGIKKRIDKELKEYVLKIDKAYRLKSLSFALFDNIREFISRDGKRIRPILFCIGYLGFKNRPATGLYQSALSLELLHDFMLVHDDIIDKSDTRRGRPSMHAMLNRYLCGKKNLKFSGEDLTIVIGDVMYALALDAFLAIKEDPVLKELALRKLISATLYTGSGEFIELLLGAKPIEKVSKDDIYKIYEYKTANYSFASPLAIGATLAGAKKKYTDSLFEYGICLGKAFQIKDDIIGTFSESAETGKSNLTDLAEAKKTILIWHAYNNACADDKKVIRKVLSGGRAGRKELIKIRRILIKSNSLQFAKDEVKRLSRQAEAILKKLPLKEEYYKALNQFTKKILTV